MSPDRVVSSERRILPDKLFDPRTATKNALIELGILGRQEINEDLINIFAPRMFNPGMVRVLQPVDLPKSLQSLPYDNDPLPGIPVFSSGMARPLIDAGYKVLAMVDVGRLYDVNQIPEVGEKLGDRVLREVAKGLVEGFPRCKVVRWGGDEFLVLGQEDLDPRQFTKVVTHIKAKPCFYQTNNETASKISLNQKPEPDFPSLMVEHNGGKIQDRIEFLIKLHPEVTPALKGLETRTEEQQKKLLYLFEQIFFDPILQKQVEIVGKTIHIYHDPTDFAEHLMGEKTPQQALIRMEIPGVLKAINDERGFGYNAGNAFIIFMFQNIVDSLEKNGLTSINMLRRGGDFFLAIPQGVRVKEVEEALSASFQKEHYKALSNNKNMVLPCVSVVVTEELHFEQHQTGQEKIAHFHEVMGKIGKAIWGETVKKLWGYYYDEGRNPYLDDNDWNFLARYLLNPYDKRGILRLRKLGLGVSETDELGSLYHPVEEGKQDNFILRVKDILQRNILLLL